MVVWDYIFEKQKLPRKNGENMKHILFEGSQRLENSQKVVVPAVVRKFLKFCVESSRGFALHFSVVSTPSRLRSAA